MIPTKQCQTCRGEFTRREHDSATQWDRRRFCSAQCGSIGKRRPGQKPVEPPPISMAWQADAACTDADPNEFFAVERWDPKRAGELWRTADRWCRECPVLAECGAFADHYRLVGLWSGSFRSGQTNKYQARPLIAQAPPVTLTDRRNVA